MARLRITYANVCLVVVALAIACGDGYDEAATGPADGGAEAATNPPVSPTTDGAVDAGDAADAADAAVAADTGADASRPRCDPRKPFTKVELVPGIPKGATCPRLIPDESIVFYSMDKETRTATREVGGAFGVGTTVSVTDANPSCATVSADRTRLFYDDFFNVYQQSGPAGGPYSAKTGVAPPAGLFVSTPFYDEPRSQLYATLHIEKNTFFGNTAIAVAPVTGGSVGAFQRIDVGYGVTGGDEPRDASSPQTYRYAAPVASQDGLALYYLSMRTDDGGIGDGEIWVSTRASLDRAFTEPTKLAGVNSPYFDVPSWISPDGCRLYLHSDREHPGIFAPSDAFLATREP